jgi:hypothetical protein
MTHTIYSSCPLSNPAFTLRNLCGQYRGFHRKCIGSNRYSVIIPIAWVEKNYGLYGLFTDFRRHSMYFSYAGTPYWTLWMLAMSRAILGFRLEASGACRDRRIRKTVARMSVWRPACKGLGQVAAALIEIFWCNPWPIRNLPSFNLELIWRLLFR